jgi:hypothetical protein
MRYSKAKALIGRTWTLSLKVYNIPILFWFNHIIFYAGGLERSPNCSNDTSNIEEIETFSTICNMPMGVLLVHVIDFSSYSSNKRTMNKTLKYEIFIICYYRTLCICPSWFPISQLDHPPDCIRVLSKWIKILASGHSIQPFTDAVSYY